MHYRRLGRSGLKVSEISFGAMATVGSQIDEGTAIDLIHAAFEQGINFFDNADVYSNGQAEVIMGRAIRDLPRQDASEVTASRHYVSSPDAHRPACQ